MLSASPAEVEEAIRTSLFLPKIGIEQFEDRFITYGYGVVAFHKMIRSLIKVFALLCLIVALPQVLVNTYYFDDGRTSIGLN